MRALLLQRIQCGQATLLLWAVAFGRWSLTVSKLGACVIDGLRWPLLASSPLALAGDWCLAVPAQLPVFRGLARLPVDDDLAAAEARVDGFAGAKRAVTAPFAVVFSSASMRATRLCSSAAEG